MKFYQRTTYETRTISSDNFVNRIWNWRLPWTRTCANWQISQVPAGLCATSSV